MFPASELHVSVLGTSQPKCCRGTLILQVLLLHELIMFFIPLLQWLLWWTDWSDHILDLKFQILDNKTY